MWTQGLLWEFRSGTNWDATSYCLATKSVNEGENEEYEKDAF